MPFLQFMLHPDAFLIQASNIRVIPYLLPIVSLQMILLLHSDDLQSDVSASQHHHEDHQLRAKITLFALANIMMELMAKSADKSIHTHGGAAWKAFSRALMSCTNSDLI